MIGAIIGYSLLAIIGFAVLLCALSPFILSGRISEAEEHERDIEDLR